jgi:hypothetical protein
MSQGPERRQSAVFRRLLLIIPARPGYSVKSKARKAREPVTIRRNLLIDSYFHAGNRIGTSFALSISSP